MTHLKERTCKACDGSAPLLTEEQIADFKSKLHKDWVLDEDQISLSRRLAFKGFAKAVYAANLAAFISDKEGHHADVAFGWGYCNITYTSHELGRLSENDFICAAKMDAALS
ncbi:4a-hydroxytetrahydrobiopterin dehydratase [Rhizobiaceae bacterium]|nr:4a-hydroxytetrahydrobiopterin dehydratase [Rhizobiaceae bacterium]